MRKLRVILVDDEILICKLIRMKVCWEALGMEVVEEFTGSKKALEALPEIKPDIIITDICMPGMDGIEFSEECISLMPDVKIIILTGYDEFKYAVRSIHIGVADYILKPVNKEKLKESLLQIKEKIEEEQHKAQKYEELTTLIEENLPVFCENYLNQVILNTTTPDIFRNKMKYYKKNLNPDSEKIQVAILEIKAPVSKENAGIRENEEIIIYIKARKYTEQFFSKDPYMFFLRDGIGRIVILSNNDKVSFMECLELLKKMLITNLKCYITIGIGRVKESYAQIGESYKEAAEALCYKVVEGDNCLIFYEELNNNTQYFSNEEQRNWEEAKIYLSAGMGEKAKDSVRKIWKDYEGSEHGNDYKARNMYAKIVTWCFQEAVLSNMENQMQYRTYREKLTDTESAEFKVCDYKRLAVNCVLTLAGEMSRKRDKKNSSTIHEIMKYMNENLADSDLSMHKVAEHSFISTGHLGRIMKKYLGKTYGEYLSELRFYKAKELLLKTDLKGYEIGALIGILDSHYLSIWFKKMEGCSLSEYRKKKKQKPHLNNECLGPNIEFSFHREPL